MKINFTKLFLFIILLSFGFLHAQVSGNQDSSDNSGQELNALSPIDVIAESIKDYVSVYSDEEFVDLVKYQFYKIHMMDESGMWITEEFAQISDTLLPADISIADAYDLIDQIAANMKKNPFFVGFINAAFEKEFAVLFNKIETEGEAVIPEAVAWALALENIIKAQLNDPAFLDYAVQYWIGEREKSGVTFADMGLFGAIKLKSVEIPLQNLLEIHRDRKSVV